MASQVFTAHIIHGGSRRSNLDVTRDGQEVFRKVEVYVRYLVGEAELFQADESRWHDANSGGGGD